MKEHSNQLIPAAVDGQPLKDADWHFIQRLQFSGIDGTQFNCIFF